MEPRVVTWQRTLKPYRGIKRSHNPIGLFLLAMGLMTLILVIEVWLMPLGVEIKEVPHKGEGGIDSPSSMIRFYRSWRVLMAYLYLFFKYLPPFIILGFLRIGVALARGRYRFSEPDYPFRGNAFAIAWFTRAIPAMSVLLSSVPFTDLIYRRWLDSLRGIPAGIDPQVEHLVAAEFFKGLLTSSIVMAEAFLLYSISQGFLITRTYQMALGEGVEDQASFALQISSLSSRLKALYILWRGAIFVVIFSSLGSSLLQWRLPDPFLMSDPAPAALARLTSISTTIGEGSIAIGYLVMVWIYGVLASNVLRSPDYVGEDKSLPRGPLSSFDDLKPLKHLYTGLIVLSIFCASISVAGGITCALQYRDEGLLWFIRVLTGRLAHPLLLLSQVSSLILLGLGSSFICPLRWIQITRTLLNPLSHLPIRVISAPLLSLEDGEIRKMRRPLRVLKVFGQFYLSFILFTFLVDILVLSLGDFLISFNYLFSALLSQGICAPYGILLYVGGALLEELLPPALPSATRRSRLPWADEKSDRGRGAAY